MATIKGYQPEGIEQHHGSYRIRFNHRGASYKETHPGDLSKRHLREVIKRRDWLFARLNLGLPIEQTDAAQLSEIAEDYFESLDVKHSTLKNHIPMSQQCNKLPRLNSHWRAMPHQTANVVCPNRLH